MTTPIEPAETVDAATAISWLPGRPRVHTRLGQLGGRHMSCAYWTRGEIEGEILRAGRVDIAGPQARAEGYGLAILKDGGRSCLFIECHVPESSIRYRHSAPVGAN
jgi:hypothetical protein